MHEITGYVQKCRASEVQSLLLTDLLRHFPDLRLCEGQPEHLHVYRLDLMDPASIPVDNTLYLHSDASAAESIVEGWLQNHRVRQLGVLTPLVTATSNLSRRRTPAVAWLEYGHGEPLPLDLSARLLRLLMEQPVRGGGHETEQLLDELVEELLTRSDAQTADILQRAFSLGVDLSTMTQVIVVGSRSHERVWQPVPGVGPLPSRQGLFVATRRAALEAAPRARVFRIGFQVAVLFNTQADSAESLARQLGLELQRDFPAHYVLAALGESVPGTATLAHSYRTARAALEISLERPQQTRWVSYDGVRHLLLYQEIHRNPELTQLVEGSIRPLLELNGEYRRVLLDTLAAYLEHNRSPIHAATALGVHPNTLKYRMKRIGEFLDLRSVSGNQFVLYYLATQLNRADR